MPRFYFILVLCAVFMGSAIEFGASEGWFTKPSFGLEIILILTFFTGLIFFRLHKTRSENFTQTYLFTIVLKLLLGGILIGVILFMDKRLAVENALFFIINYLLFTALEVFFLFRKLNSPSNPKL